MRTAVTELGPYMVLILAGLLPNEVWRIVGLVTARGLNEESELVIWCRTVAIALLAGVIAKLILFSSGELAGIPVAVRIGAAAIALTAFLVSRRSVFAGVLAGEAALLIGGYLLTP